MTFDFSSLFLFSGIVNAGIGILYNATVYRTGNRGKFWLTLLLIIQVVILTECIFRNSRLVDQFPHVLFISTLGFFALPPVVYCYQAQILQKKTVVWVHFIITGLILVMMIPTYSMSAHDKITMFRTAGLNDPVWVVAVYVVYFLFYQFRIAKAHVEYKRKLTSAFSNTAVEWERISSGIISMAGLSALAIPVIMILQYLSLSPETDSMLTKSITVLFSLTPHFVVVSLLLKRDIDEIPETPEEKIPGIDLERQKTELEVFMRTYRCFLENDLTLDGLASKIGWSRSSLSSVINTGFKQNFYDFVNSFRLAALDERLKSQDHIKYSLDHIVKECGFTSYVTFYRFFKRTKGESPSAYLKSFENRSK